MAKRKKQDSLTPRQRQSQRIMREKAARKKRQNLWRRTQIIGGGALALTMIGGGLWLWLSGTAAHIAATTIDGAYRMTANAGFNIQAVYLEGRNRTAMKDIGQALGIKKGESIFRVGLEESRARLEQIESVRMAAVERSLPHTLYVRIVEREPVALWQHQGKLTLIDDNGVAMHDIDSAPYQHLPLMIGADAPQHVMELLTILASQPALAERFSAAIHVGGRRWNIRLKGDIEVKLPEDDPMAAWQALAGLQADQQLLNRAVKVIDLRLPGRLFITVSPQDTPQRAANAKDA